MTSPLESLIAALDLEPTGPDRFRGLTPAYGWRRVFGGQVVAQALIAVQRTVPGRAVHSLHAYFLRPGDPETPIDFTVERVRDGASFSTRSLVAEQRGAAIFTLQASFHGAEPGLDHQTAAPAVVRPETLPSPHDLAADGMDGAPDVVRRYWERTRAIELRPLDMRHYVSREALPAEQVVWMRAAGPVGPDPALHAAILAYASDMTLLDTAFFAHGRSVFDRDIQAASLDHALWFHRPVDVTDWLLYAQDSPSTAGARGFTRGAFYDGEGRLVASTAQEGLMRLRR
jgi:acyl-CoA thioesterase-2